MLIAVVATVFWQWSAIREFYQLTGPEPRGHVTHNTPTAQSKTSVGVAQQQSNADAHRTTLPNGKTVPAGQQVLLYEEDPTDPQGKRYTGSAIWRTETISTMAGLAPEVGIRADVSIPDRGMAVTWSLRRSTDKGAPPSYTIETKFNLSADLHGAEIANVPSTL
jgi:hypothetical protein